MNPNYENDTVVPTAKKPVIAPPIAKKSKKSKTKINLFDRDELLKAVRPRTRQYTNSVSLWRKPIFTKELGEFKRVSQEFNIPMKVLRKHYTVGKRIRLPLPIWDELSNTDSGSIKSFDELSRALISYKKPKSLVKILAGFVQGEMMDTPIIVKLAGKDKPQYHLIAGNTRLCICKLLGIIPMITLVQ